MGMERKVLQAAQIADAGKRNVDAAARRRCKLVSGSSTKIIWDIDIKPCLALGGEILDKRRRSSGVDGVVWWT